MAGSVLSSTQAERLQDFVAEHGAETLDLLLDLGHLASQDMRALSRLAVKHSADYAQAQLPHTLIFHINPSTKIVGQRVEARLVTGKVQLSLEAGTVGG